MSQDLIDLKLDQLRSAGVKVTKGGRSINSPHLSGTNREVHESWMTEWINNGFANYPIIKRAKGIDSLQNIAKGIPAFVVGIGVSFEKQVESLRYSRGRAVVVSTDAALRILLKNGIKPDLVISLDCKFKQSDLWKTVETQNIPIVFHSCTHPDNIQSWKGKKLFFNIHQQDGDWHQVILPNVYNHLGKLDACGTVGNAGILIASGMGCDPIFGVGMDLCYQKVGDAYRYRCDDWCLDPEGKWQVIKKPLLYDNDQRLSKSFDVMINGKSYKVDKPLEFYRKSLLNIVGKSFVNFINCSPGGTLDNNIATLGVMEAIDKHCQKQLEPFESALFHLNKLLDDPVELWKKDLSENKNWV